ncbi:hypothetical protein BpHYR1_038113 [Brachionus plicatilis]|uniref:Uncharacterized protein n=1 Tax=Brachionus plicatilis TaxID=10195 RepID=A0A3M7PDD5_BRAPC|nr:hypothetical protein BpHYR1_038113 [Brachionus plicatilis]
MYEEFVPKRAIIESVSQEMSDKEIKSHFNSILKYIKLKQLKVEQLIGVKRLGKKWDWGKNYYKPTFLLIN